MHTVDRVDLTACVPAPPLTPSRGEAFVASLEDSPPRDEMMVWVAYGVFVVCALWVAMAMHAGSDSDGGWAE